MPTGGLIAGIGDFGVEALVTQAEQAKSSAESSASTATTKANQASASATTATTQAGIATTKASEANASAIIAMTESGVATTKAGEAQTSASNASASENNALNYKNSAVSASNTATTKAGEAQQSAGDAQQSAWNAADSADLAEGSKNLASQFADSAQQSANQALANDKPFVKASEVILKGQPVYISNANGTNAIVSLASNTTETRSSNVYGLALQNFAINDILQVVRRGDLTGLDTSTATVGDSVWLGVNGQKLYGIANKPLGTHLVYLGIVKRAHANQGVIDVDIKNGFEVEELHNVTFTSLQETDLFGYIGGKWQNVPRYFRVAKYTAESQLPITGDVGTVYFLNVAGSKYLKYWNGTAYVNASTKTDLPKCVSSVQKDYYATFADISISNYTGRIASIIVIEDETQENQNGFYVFNGTSLVWILTQ
jgi:hypothetical protein